MKVYKEKRLGYAAGLFYSFLMWTGTLVLTVFFTVADIFIAFPLSLLFEKGSGGFAHKVTNLWARGIIGCNPIWKLAVTGRSRIEKGKHYIVIANHQSMLDILVVAAALPLHFKFLAKKELFSIPFLGWAMSCAGYIPVDRASHESGRRAMKRIQALLAKGLSVLLFPEGTRSPDGKIHGFKAGAFKLARESGVEILPVVIDGTGSALPKRSLVLRNRTRFVVSIGKPVSFATLNDRSLDEARESVRHEMVARLARLRHGRQL